MTFMDATAELKITPRMTSQRAFFGVSALLFVVSTVITIVWCTSMPAVGMPMPGGWTMSMAWMRMPEQTWAGTAAEFIGMWSVMMVAMMFPSFIPMLGRYRQVLDRASGSLTALVAVGYFFVWTAFGIVAFALGVSVAGITMRQPALARVVPVVTGVVVVIAGAIQFSAWKMRHLVCCREEPECLLRVDPGTAWRHGLRLGLHCTYCCAGFMAILLVMGVMNLRVMTVVTAIITVERLAPSGERVARIIGALVVAVGFFLILRAG